MADYIKRDALLKTWCESYCRPKQNCREDCSFYDAITQSPAADVRENVRGHWIVKEDAWITSYKCSCCGTTWSMDLCDDRFCSHCGADMRGEG